MRIDIVSLFPEFVDQCAGFGVTGQRRLRNAQVLMVGAGGLGGEQGRDVEAVAVGVPMEGHAAAPGEPGGEDVLLFLAAAHVEGVLAAAHRKVGQVGQEGRDADAAGDHQVAPGGAHRGEQVARPACLERVAGLQRFVEGGFDVVGRTAVLGGAVAGLGHGTRRLG